MTVKSIITCINLHVLRYFSSGNYAWKYVNSYYNYLYLQTALYVLASESPAQVLEVLRLFS